jgi:peptidoglycan/xylan/chitin deacetylase (PgdA/CDA1 family)
MKENKRFVTIDLESDWGGRSPECRGVELMTEPVLELLAAHNAKATFFISTETLNRTERLVRLIASAGHEIASHGHNHWFYYDNLDRKSLHEQVRRSKEILENLTGNAVLGFRTPYFKKNAFTEEVLIETGYRYDSSSVNSSFLKRYKAHQFEIGKLPEFPVSSLFGRIPAGIKWMNFFRTILAGTNPIIIYVHLFDLLSVHNTLSLYQPGISNKIAAFYLVRLGSTFKTLTGLVGGSRSLCDLINMQEEVSNAT